MEPSSSPLPDSSKLKNVRIPAPLDTGISISMSKGSPIISPLLARRKGSKKHSMTPTVIKRSASSPNVHAMASSEPSSASMSDKRRNKLGYHRTSVACGHCRRRKIRCLLAPGDDQGRCSNCIRLKKECNFYPVDQQPLPPPTEKRVRSGSKAEGSLSNDAATSSSSSPSHQPASNVVEQVASYHHMQPHPLQTTQENQTLNPYSASTLSPPERTPRSGLGYEFSQSLDPSPSWDHSSFLQHSPQNLAVDRHLPEDASGSYWRPSGSSMAGSYAPSQSSVPSSSISMTPSSQWSKETFTSRVGSDDRGWRPPPAPIRSMSLVAVEELPAGYQGRYFQQPSSTTAGRMSATTGAASPSFYGHAPPSIALGEPHPALPAGALTSLAHAGAPVGFTFPQWETYTPQSTEMMGSSASRFPPEWYGGSAHLGLLRGEGGNSPQYRSPSGPSPHQRNPG